MKRWTPRTLPSPSGFAPRPLGIAPAMTSESPKEGPQADHASRVRLGSWNLSHWTVDRAESISTALDLDIVALQETHLAPLPLERAHSTAHRLGLHLHHGHPTTPQPGSVHGRSCGVGFTTLSGMPASPVWPIGPSWRMLYAMGRLHAIRLGPFPTMPHAFLILTFYVP